MKASGEMPRTITITGVAYSLLTDSEPNNHVMSPEAREALVQLSAKPDDDATLRKYRTDHSIRIPATRFADKYALHGTPILDEHDASRQVGLIKCSRVQGDKLIIDAELNDATAIAKVMNKEYTGLSIGYKPTVLGDGTMAYTIKEVSVCSEPYFNDCLLTDIQASIKALEAGDGTNNSQTYIPCFAPISVVAEPKTDPISKLIQSVSLSKSTTVNTSETPVSDTTPASLQSESTPKSVEPLDTATPTKVRISQLRCLCVCMRMYVCVHVRVLYVSTCDSITCDLIRVYGVCTHAIAYTLATQCTSRGSQSPDG